MRVAVDLRPLQIGHEYRGIGTYLTNILARLPDTEKHHFIFYQYDTSDPLTDYQLHIPRSYETIRIPKPIWRKSVPSLMKYVKAGLYPSFPNLKRSKPDIFLQSDFQLGLPKIRGCKNFVIIYDLIPLILSEHYMPSWKKPLFNRTFRWYTRLIVTAKWAFHEKRYLKNLKKVRQAYKILSISNSTTDDLQTYLKIDKDNIVTIPLAPSFRAGDEPSPRLELVRQIEKIKNPYLVFIGGTDARRKIDDLIYAFNIINSRGHDVDLVLVGNEFRKVKLVPSHSARNAIMASSYKDQIHLLGYLTESEKEYVLNHAAAFVYPTLYEGFGLPILEAMHSGCPVITFNNSSIPEVGGKAVIYTSSPDIKGIAEAVQELLDDDKLAKDLSKKGISRAAQFDWDTTAKKTWELLVG